MEEENNNINDIPKINGKEIGVKEVPINSPKMPLAHKATAVVKPFI